MFRALKGFNEQLTVLPLKLSLIVTAEMSGKKSGY